MILPQARGSIKRTVHSNWDNDDLTWGEKARKKVCFVTLLWAGHVTCGTVAGHEFGYSIKLLLKQIIENISAGILANGLFTRLLLYPNPYHNPNLPFFRLRRYQYNRSSGWSSLYYVGEPLTKQNIFTLWRSYCTPKKISSTNNRFFVF